MKIVKDATHQFAEDVAKDKIDSMKKDAFGEQREYTVSGAEWKASMLFRKYRIHIKANLANTYQLAMKYSINDDNTANILEIHGEEELDFSIFQFRCEQPIINGTQQQIGEIQVITDVQVKDENVAVHRIVALLFAAHDFMCKKSDLVGLLENLFTRDKRNESILSDYESERAVFNAAHPGAWTHQSSKKYDGPRLRMDGKEAFGFIKGCMAEFCNKLGRNDLTIISDVLTEEQKSNIKKGVSAFLNRLNGLNNSSSSITNITAGGGSKRAVRKPSSKKASAQKTTPKKASSKKTAPKKR
jgi:hypothetical protein